ncbi:nucleoside-diphosphate sugar epimerase [Neobacillus mesonae]|nr:nucleoside-diphosphate sugar epimerase [Neobacillus mesonae]
MQQRLDEMLVHLANSHQQIARVLEAERHVNVRMAEMISVMPDILPHFTDMQGLIDGTGQLNTGIVAYLGHLADLEEMIADSIGHIVREMAEVDEE